MRDVRKGLGWCRIGRRRSRRFGLLQLWFEIDGVGVSKKDFCEKK